MPCSLPRTLLSTALGKATADWYLKSLRRPGLCQCTYLFLENLKLSPWPKAKILQISRGKCPWTDESGFKLCRFQVSGRTRYPTSDVPVATGSVLDSDPSATQSSAHRQKSLAESTTSSIKFSYTTQWVLLLTTAAATPSVLPQLVRHTLSEVPSEEGAAEVQLRQVSQMSSQTTLLRKGVWKG